MHYLIGLLLFLGVPLLVLYLLLELAIALSGT